MHIESIPNLFRTYSESYSETFSETSKPEKAQGFLSFIDATIPKSMNRKISYVFPRF